MSPREKKLLILFLIGGLVMINFLGISFYQKTRAELNDRRLEAERKVQAAEMFRESRDQALKEMEWLAERMPEPAENQDVQVALEAYCKKEAMDAGLTVGKIDLQQTDSTPGRFFHRAKIQFSVSGPEEALYNWLQRVHMPDKLRAPTRLVMKPKSDDDTQIQCMALIEQWFVPTTSP